MLVAVHEFYTQQVQLPWGLRQALGVQDVSAGRCQEEQQHLGEDAATGNAVDSHRGCIDEGALSVEQQYGAGSKGEDALASGDGGGCAAVDCDELTQPAVDVVAAEDMVWVKRSALLGASCCFGGLQRVSRDAHSTVYQVVLE